MNSETALDELLSLEKHQAPQRRSAKLSIDEFALYEKVINKLKKQTEEKTENKTVLIFDQENLDL